MTRNLKALGLALLAVFALSAVAASAASAANDVFTSTAGAEKTDLTGSSSNPKLVAGGTGIVCAKGTYATTVTGNAVNEITVHPTYDTPCEIPGLGEASVDTDGCDYLLTGTTDTVGTETHATVNVECTSGKEILITGPLGVTIHIGAQNNLLGVTYQNGEENGKGTVTVKATVKGITYSCTGFFCFILENSGNGNNGVYEDDVVVTGYNDTGTFSRNSTTHAWSGTHGEQVSVSVD